MRSALIIILLFIPSVVFADMFNSPWKQTINDDGTIIYSFAGGGTLTVTSSFDAESGTTSNNLVFAISDPPSDISDYYGSGLPYGEGAATSIIYPDGYDWSTISSAAVVNYDPSTQETTDDDESGTSSSSQNVNVNVDFPDEMTVTGKVEIDMGNSTPVYHDYDYNSTDPSKPFFNDLGDDPLSASSTYLIWDSDGAYSYSNSGSNWKHQEGDAWVRYDPLSDGVFRIPGIDWDKYKLDVLCAIFGENDAIVSSYTDNFVFPGRFGDWLSNIKGGASSPHPIDDLKFSVHCPFGGSFQYWEVTLPFNSWSQNSIVQILRSTFGFFVYLEVGFLIFSLIVKRS